jgi:hypothetical protein
MRWCRSRCRGALASQQRGDLTGLAVCTGGVRAARPGRGLRGRTEQRGPADCLGCSRPAVRSGRADCDRRSAGRAAADQDQHTAAAQWFQGELLTWFRAGRVEPSRSFRDEDRACPRPGSVVLLLDRVPPIELASVLPFGDAVVASPALPSAEVVVCACPNRVPSGSSSVVLLLEHAPPKDGSGPSHGRSVSASAAPIGLRLSCALAKVLPSSRRWLGSRARSRASGARRREATRPSRSSRRSACPSHGSAACAGTSLMCLAGDRDRPSRARSWCGFSTDWRPYRRGVLERLVA